ncbi:MAG: hypothetical protein AAFV86_08850 [Pseudomonadota bacterium]
MTDTLLIVAGLTAAVIALAILWRVFRTARAVQRGEIADPDRALKRLIVENGIAVALGILAAGLLAAAWVIG